MPELPEVETVRRTLELAIMNEEIIEVVDYYSKIITNDLAYFKRKIQFQSINKIHRMGKYLIFILDTDVMIIHLRMEGKFFIKRDEPILKHEHVVFKFKSGKELRYHDVRKFGTITLLPRESYLEVYPLNQLAPEPKDLNYNKLYEALQKKRIEIKAVLLDQHIISGLGNIYVDETLFLSKIHPTRLANTISLEETKEMIKRAIQVLDKATKLGGTTIRSYTSSLGVHGRFQNELYVHMRKDLPCKICQTKIIKMKVKGRGTYVCPSCQD